MCLIYPTQFLMCLIYPTQCLICLIYPTQCLMRLIYPTQCSHLYECHSKDTWHSRILLNNEQWELMGLAFQLASFES